MLLHCTLCLKVFNFFVIGGFSDSTVPDFIEQGPSWKGDGRYGIEVFMFWGKDPDSRVVRACFRADASIFRRDKNGETRLLVSSCPSVNLSS